MSDLSPDGKMLVREAREADRPSPADRERVRQALGAHLGEAATLGVGLGLSPLVRKRGPAPGVIVARWTLLGCSVLLSSALLVPHAWRHAVPAGPPASVNVSMATAEPHSLARDTASSKPAPSAVVARPAGSAADLGARRPLGVRTAPSRTRDGLSEEVALLSRAETELRAEHPANALLALAEHQRKFPRGALAEERTAARIQALCALGRTGEAHAQLAKLAQLSPNSPHEARARQACLVARAAH